MLSPSGTSFSAIHSQRMVNNMKLIELLPVILTDTVAYVYDVDNGDRVAFDSVQAIDDFDADYEVRSIEPIDSNSITIGVFFP